MPYTALTRADLRDRLAQRYEGKPFWTEDEANRLLNEALCTWNQLTGRWVQTILLPATAGTYLYSIPTALLYRTRITWNGLPLSPSSREDLNNGRPAWRQETTASGGDVPATPSLWAPVSLRLFYLWPADADGNNSLRLDGVANTPTLTADADYVDLAEADLSALLNYALHIALFKKGGPWFQASMPYFLEFLTAAGQENSRITTSQAYRRFLGLDHRDQKSLTGAPSSVAGLVKAASEALA